MFKCYKINHLKLSNFKNRVTVLIFKIHHLNKDSLEQFIVFLWLIPFKTKGITKCNKPLSEKEWKHNLHIFAWLFHQLHSCWFPVLSPHRPARKACFLHCILTEGILWKHFDLKVLPSVCQRNASKHLLLPKMVLSYKWMKNNKYGYHGMGGKCGI